MTFKQGNKQHIGEIVFFAVEAKEQSKKYCSSS